MNIVGKRFDTGQFVRIVTRGGEVASCTVVDAAINGTTANAPWVAPGLVDIQTNGYGGQEFSSPLLTAEKAARIVRQHWPFGVTALAPTITTNSHEATVSALRAIAAAAELPELDRQIVGIHVEGPYFSTEDGPRGAHPLEHCRRPDWDEFQRFQEAAKGRIRILTMSAEFGNAPEFIARVSASGVVVALGHMSATSDQIRAAVDAGARLSTHLGNGSHRMLRRHPNYLWDQLAEDRLLASLIVDAHHLPPEVVKTFIRAKTPERCILISDLSGLAGLPPGRYDGENCTLEILADGKLVIAGQDQLLAGASRPLGVGVAGACRFAGVSLPEAIAMAATRPSELIGYRPGGFSPGDPADFVLFDFNSASETPLVEMFQVRSTISGGRCVYEATVAAHA
jgi:N-acetylglucosamine-6-phosphate deacetylase